MFRGNLQLRPEPGIANGGVGKRLESVLLAIRLENIRQVPIIRAVGFHERCDLLKVYPSVVPGPRLVNRRLNRGGAEKKRGLRRWGVRSIGGRGERIPQMILCLELGR